MYYENEDTQTKIFYEVMKKLHHYQKLIVLTYNKCNHCIVEHEGKNPLFYTWTEDQASRGCTDVDSSLLDFLSKVDIEENITDLFHMVHTLLFWLQQTETNIKSIYLH